MAIAPSCLYFHPKTTISLPHEEYADLRLPAVIYDVDQLAVRKKDPYPRFADHAALGRSTDETRQAHLVSAARTPLAVAFNVQVDVSPNSLGKASQGGQGYRRAALTRKTDAVEIKGCTGAAVLNTALAPQLRFWYRNITRGWPQTRDC